MSEIISVGFKPEVILCSSCEHFEDQKLKTVYFYDSRGRTKGQYQVRYYCYGYHEYLMKFYSKCVKHKRIKRLSGRKVI